MGGALKNMKHNLSTLCKCPIPSPRTPSAGGEGPHPMSARAVSPSPPLQFQVLIVKKEANVLEGSLCAHPLWVWNGDRGPSTQLLSVCLQLRVCHGALQGRLGRRAVFSKVAGIHCAFPVPTTAHGVFPEEQGRAEWPAISLLPPPRCPPLAAATVGLGTVTCKQHVG